jgi:hypothetical protein
VKKIRCVFISIIAVISVCLLAGCGESGSVQVTFVPSSAEPARTEIPLPSGVSFEEEVYEDLNNDGADETITFYSTHIDSPDEFLTVLIVSGTSGTYMESIEDCEYESFSFTRTQSGEACLFINLWNYLCYDTDVYSFDGIRPVNLCNLGHITDVSGTDITEEGPVDALGTWHYSRIYKLNDDLSLEPGDYQIIMDDKEPLHTIEKLPVELLIDEVYTKGYIDAGKYIIPVSTDGDSYLKFRLENGLEGRIVFSRQDYDIYIDGKSEYEYFDNIEYTDMLY